MNKVEAKRVRRFPFLDVTAEGRLDVVSTPLSSASGAYKKLVLLRMQGVLLRRADVDDVALMHRTLFGPSDKNIYLMSTKRANDMEMHI